MELEILGMKEKEKVLLCEGVITIKKKKTLLKREQVMQKIVNTTNAPKAVER